VTSQELEIRGAVLSLFAAWLIHDREEVFTFPATSRLLARRLGTTRLAITRAQSAGAIALMGVLVAHLIARVSVTRRRHPGTIATISIRRVQRPRSRPGLFWARLLPARIFLSPWE